MARRSRAPRCAVTVYPRARVTKKLARDGALWVVRPKGKDGVAEAAVVSAGKRAGLVDVKVARYSETHTAEKFVIPLARR